MKRSFTTYAFTFAAFASALTLAAGADTVQAKKGTEMDTTLQTALDSKTNHNGDTFQLVDKEGFFHHAPAALKGATIDGHVENVAPAGPTHKASMTLVFDDIKLADGTTESAPIKLESLSLEEPKTHHVRDVGLIVGGYVAGHHMAASKHGGVAGAAAGFALASALKSDIKIKNGTLVKIKFTSDLTPSASAQ